MRIESWWRSESEIKIKKKKNKLYNLGSDNQNWSENYGSI